jgi:hypothetical protein
MKNFAMIMTLCAVLATGAVEARQELMPVPEVPGAFVESHAVPLYTNVVYKGAVADFGRSQRSAIPGGRGSCRAVRFRSAVARREPRPPKFTIIRDYTPLRQLMLKSPKSVCRLGTDTM